MAIPTDWKGHTSPAELVAMLDGVTVAEYDRAVRESRYNYIERTITDKGKPRHLCYPPKDSVLRKVLEAIKDCILLRIEILPNIRGYTKGAHNINVAAHLCKFRHAGKLDVSRYHPSIKTGHVANALVKHGLSWPWARRIARLVTYRGRVTQGAPTSNHIANIVMDVMFRTSVVPFADSLGVGIVNYGDDIAFCCDKPDRVRKCVIHAKNQLSRYGFMANDKGRDCEHRGAERLFLGCATGRSQPDLPRKKYRAFRSELRAILRRERRHLDGSPVTSEKKVKSIKHRIGYVQRLNKRKARRLRDIYYRICAVRRQKLRSGAGKSPSRPDTSVPRASTKARPHSCTLNRDADALAPWE